MRRSKRYGIKIPEYSDPADIGVIGDAIEALETAVTSVVVMKTDIPISERIKNTFYLKLTAVSSQLPTSTIAVSPTMSIKIAD